MSKAAKKALEAYPTQLRTTVYGGTTCIDDDIIKAQRTGFIVGYEQAERDLALTIDDIEGIHVFLYALKYNKHGAFTFTRLSDKQYKEVLRRFLATRKEK